jgi:archaemetzincin
MKQTNILEGVGNRINDYTEKPQYNAKDILIKLQKSLKPDAFCLLGVAFTDLYPKDEWNFVFGLASIRDRTGVFSFARYDPRFF